jgi:hypothetical protein
MAGNHRLAFLPHSSPAPSTATGSSPDAPVRGGRSLPCNGLAALALKIFMKSSLNLNAYVRFVLCAEAQSQERAGAGSAGTSEGQDDMVRSRNAGESSYLPSGRSHPEAEADDPERVCLGQDRIKIHGAALRIL